MKLLTLNEILQILIKDKNAIFYSEEENKFKISEIWIDELMYKGNDHHWYKDIYIKE